MPLRNNRLSSRPEELETMHVISLFELVSSIRFRLRPLTLKILKRRATLSKDLNTDSRSTKTCDGSRTDAQAVKPEISENITVTWGNKSAIGLPSKLFPLLSTPCKLWITAFEKRLGPLKSFLFPAATRLFWSSVALSISRSLTVAGKRELCVRGSTNLG